MFPTFTKIAALKLFRTTLVIKLLENFKAISLGSL